MIILKVLAIVFGQIFALMWLAWPRDGYKR